MKKITEEDDKRTLGEFIALPTWYKFWFFFMAIYSKTSFNGIILESSGIKSLVQEFTIPFMKNESLQSLPAESVEYSHNLTCIFIN